MDDRGRREDALAAGAEQAADRRDRADRAVLPESEGGLAQGPRPRRRLRRSRPRPDGRADVTIAGKSQRLDVVLGPNYRAAVDLDARRAAASSASNRWPASPTRSTSRTAACTTNCRASRREARGRESFWVRPQGYLIGFRSAVAALNQHKGHEGHKVRPMGSSFVSVVSFVFDHPIELSDPPQTTNSITVLPAAAPCSTGSSGCAAA